VPWADVDSYDILAEVNTGSSVSGISRPLQIATLLSLGSFLTLVLAAVTFPVSDVDHRTRTLVHLTRSPALDAAMNGVSGLGENYGLIPLIVLGVALLWRTSRHWAVALPLVMAGTGALQLVAKWAIDRPRPNLSPWGFPSGHVLSLAVFFGLMTYLLATSAVARPVRRLGYAGCGATVFAVAFSRVYLDAHWASDVAGGFTLGLAYLLPTIVLVEHIADHCGGDRRRDSEAQVELADDEGSGPDVDPVAEPI
jgi:membrane-associated phospholipid phosphatase